ncbi:MAG TPA: response regulator [Anaerolineales bacterium]|jgi:YesN/AraC family two-component response regulator
MPEPEPRQIEKLKVLIADDNHEMRRNVRVMLSMNPEVVVVAIARDGKEAVELAREQHPDLLVLDVHMPEMDGLEVFKKISQSHPGTACVIITGQAEAETVEAARELGVQEILLKPFSTEELNEAVERAAAEKLEERHKQVEAERLYRQSEAYLIPLAEEYTKSRRTDDEALRVFELLAENPGCEVRWLRTLAMLYVIRREWTKLNNLSARLVLLGGSDEE